MPFNDQRSLASPTGASLNLYTRKADGKERGVVQISHGLAEHAARYAGLADFLAGRGYHTYAHDHRGHGHTTAPDAPPGKFGDTDGGGKVITDVLAVHELIATEHDGLPVIAFGHSMGGLIALNFIQRHSPRLAGAAVWNANFSAGIAGYAALAILGWERFRLGSDVPSRMLPRLTFQAWGKAVPGHRTLFDWLSRDAAEVDKYIADPLCGWDASVSLWRDLFGFIFAGADDSRFAGIRKDLPVNLTGGEKDPATSGGKAVEHLTRRMRQMHFSNLVSKVYPETRHESLNEVNRNIIMEDFAAWADKVTASR
ncbi:MULTISPECIES: alpha/beta fold hydrolase [Phyllobacteriaceae]|jgi:alpha-beta hydrolase superfamily lysophospholipase|uniref:Lysophospholipase n=2 Tax=Pseudomonadota TaxID=1224 RepID=A0A1C2DYI2_9HYPH|nr:MULTISPECIES: alpha/beta hydrolase [Mesorhizobium]MBN9234770.1 alpha/beta hydrolase [Mesorhizobium sp.]MDQ0328749.1 alpha-beta hydrolase superfamily lysophospholipase [Mesorhizobium sp. YL-MeA3-2017]OCX19814.1 lysophospholipase [Mesorhizobium hungaricum]